MYTQKTYNYFYKITNLINGHFYYGVHRTDNLNDGYMGSGTRLKCAFKKYGLENFSKEILKFFETGEEAFKYESEFITEELVNNNDCYNMVLGGRCAFDNDYNLAIRDENGNCKMISSKDSSLLENDFIPYSKGYVVVKDNSGKTSRVKIDDERYLSGELVPIGKGVKLKKSHKQKLSEAM